MAERWQQWMPFHIDRWKGSAHVQAMRAAARAGYFYLLSAMWQTCDCTLPDDADDLLVMSGLAADEWEMHSRVILKRFTLADGRWSNAVLFEEWSTAKRVFESRQASAQRTNTVRKPNGDRSGDRHAEPTQEQEQEHIQEQEQKKEQKPSRGKRESKAHEHFEEIKQLIFRYYRNHNGTDPAWDGSEAKQLSTLLAAQPDSDLPYWKACMVGRHNSDVNHAERPRVWIAHLPNYRNAVNQFNRPKEAPAQPKPQQEMPQYARDWLEADQARKAQAEGRVA